MCVDLQLYLHFPLGGVVSTCHMLTEGWVPVIVRHEDDFRKSGKSEREID